MAVRKTRRRAVGLIALLAAVGVSLAGALGATAQEVDPVAVPDQPIPALTPDEVERAKAIVLGSSFLKQFRLKQAPQVVEVGVWHSEELEKLGAVVLLRLPAAIRLKGVFPSFKDKPDKGKPYTEGGAAREYESVTMILAVVDLERGKVVRLHPGPGATLNSEVVAEAPRSTR